MRTTRRPTAEEHEAHQLTLAPPTTRPTPMTEAQLLAAVRKIARITGWMIYHTHDSRRSEPGFPDLVMVHPRNNRLIFAELKTKNGRTTPAQDLWLAALDATDQEVYLIRPDDLPDLAGLLRGARPGPVGALIAGVLDHMTTRPTITSRSTP